MGAATQVRRIASNALNEADLSTLRALPAADAPGEGPEVLRVDLSGALAGHHILIDSDELTFGLLEEIQSGAAAKILTAVAIAIVGGDLPKGNDRAGLRQLRVGEMKSVITGVISATEMGKS